MFFKLSSNARAEEIRKYIPVSVATSFDNVSPLIGSAETKYILPLLGQSLYDQVLSYYNTPDPLPGGITLDNKGKFDALIEHIQRALINLTYYTGFEFLSVSMNDSGFHRQENDTEKSLFKYQEDAIKNQFKENGFNGLDTMLVFIESNIDVFTNFTSSPSHSLFKSSIIPSTSVFNDIIDINQSRLVYLKIRRFIELAEEFIIKAAIGSSLYARVKAEIIKDSPDVKITALLPFIRKPLAHFAMSEAYRFLGLQVRDRGLFFNATDTTMVNSSKETPALISDLEPVIRSERDAASNYLALLKDFITANIDDYPEAITYSGSPFIRDNTDKATFFA